MVNEAQLQPRIYRIGDVVRSMAFTDHRGIHHPESEPLTVSEISTVVNDVAPHHRLKAIGGPHRSFEAAESFFRENHQD